VDRTNVSILLACVLLGILLYIVRQIGNEGLQSVTPADRSRTPPVASAESTRVVATPVTTRSELPVVDGPTALRALLDTIGIDADAAIAAARQWYEDRGFIGANPLLGNAAQSESRDYYASLDDATLAAMSRDNDAGATQELAGRARLVDPFAALTLFEQAAQQGSVSALLQMASLQETLADVQPDDFLADPDYLRKLGRVGGRDPAGNLRFQAFVSAVTALRDGGAPVADEALLRWITDLGKRNPDARVREGCNQSFSNFLALSAARRETGLAPVVVNPPPVFLTVPDLDARLPCRDTVNPIVGTLDLGRCASMEVVDGRGILRSLYVCVDN
jgi:hypothetical protein